MISLSEESALSSNPGSGSFWGVCIYLSGALPGQLQGQAPWGAAHPFSPHSTSTAYYMPPPSSRAPGTGEPNRIYYVVLYMVGALWSVSTDLSLSSTAMPCPTPQSS